MSRGSSFEELGERAEQLACCLSLRELRVERDPADASRGTVTLVRRDPLARAGTYAVAAAGRLRATSLWEPIPLGLDEHGGTVEVSLVERSLLAGGEPGRGEVGGDVDADRHRGARPDREAVVAGREAGRAGRLAGVRGADGGPGCGRGDRAA